MTAATIPGAGHEADRRKSGERLALAVLAAWMSGLLMVFWPALRYPVFVSDSNIDASFFGYAGELVRRGGVPYLSFWDHKPPLIFYIDAAALALSGGRVWGLWMASLVTVLGAMLLAYRALRLAFGVAPALLGLTVFVAAMSRVLPVNMTEGYALPLVWGTVLLTVSVSTTGRLNRQPLACGAALGALGALAFFLRANIIGAAASASIVLTIALLRDRQLSAWLRFAAGAVLGALGVTALVVAPLAYGGALGAFWDQAFHYNFLYAHTKLGLRIRSGLFVMMDVSAFSSLVLPLAGWAAAVAYTWMSRVSGARMVVPLLGVVWPPIEMMMATTTGRPYGHYFAVVMPAVSYLTALAAWSLLNSLARAGPQLMQWGHRAIAVIAVAIALPTVLGTAIKLRDRESPRTRFEQVSATSAVIQARTAPGATVYVWGHASDVYFMAQRRPASRFIYPLALLTPRYADTTLVRGFVAELRAAAPQLIVDASAGAASGEALVPSLAVWDPRWRYPTEFGTSVQWWAMTPAIKEFYDYVAQQYVLAGYVGPKRWAVYVRATTAAVAPSRVPMQTVRSNSSTRQAPRVRP